MARELDQGMIDAQARLHEATPWIWLYELEVPTSPATRYRLTDYSQSVEFGVDPDGDPLVYSPAAVTHGVVKQTREGDIPTVTVGVGNVDTAVGKVIDTHGGMRGQPARIMLVRADTLDDPNAKIEFKARVARVGIREQTATFELRPVALGTAMFPRWRYLSQSCRFNFGGNLCGYQIPAAPGESVGTGFSTCAKHVEDCEQRGDDEVARLLERLHPLRFGGHPGIPRS